MAKNNKQYTIGIDIGGTNMKAVLFDGKNVISDDILATPKDNLDHFLVMIRALIEPMLEQAKELKIKLSGIGLGVAGVIDYSEHKMIASPNIPIIDNIKLAAKVEEMFALPTKMDNDGNCFVRAEVAGGAAQNMDNAYGLIIGTGIGGGWWVRGDVYRAAHGGSGEPGEMIIDFVEGTMLEPAYHKLTQNNPAQLAEEAYRGDTLAVKTFEEVGKFLGVAMANIVNLIAPDIIVLGGGAVASGDLFLKQAKSAMREHIASPYLQKKIKVVKGKIGENAGAIGAALLIN